MRRVVDDLSSRHEILFESIVKRLQMNDNGHMSTDACRRTFTSVVDELFADGRYNWGRVVTVVAFAGWLAKRSGGTRQSTTGPECDEWAKTTGKVAGEYVAEKLADWIYQQGGWVSQLVCYLVLPNAEDLGDNYSELVRPVMKVKAI
jgi:hypothetical protein